MLIKFRYWKLLIFLGILFFIIILQILISSYLEGISTQMTISCQKDTYLTSSMNFVSIFGSRKMKTVLLMVIFSTCNVYHSFLYVLATYSAFFVSSWLKINFQQPRPFWIHPEIIPYECEAGYGYPSNHVLPTVPCLFLFFEIFYYKFGFDRAVNAKIFYWAGLITSSVICILIGFSRMVQGVHSLDQIFFGLLMGYACYHFFFYVLDYDLSVIKHFIALVGMTFGIKQFLFITFLLYLCFLINTLFLNASYDPSWTQQIRIKCPVNPDTFYFYKCLTDSATGFIVLGTFLGIVYDMKMNYRKISNYISENLSNNYQAIAGSANNRVGKWNDTNIIYALLRIILLFLIAQIFFIIIPLMQYPFGKNLFTKFFICEAVPFFLVGFVTFAFGKTICGFFRLTNTSKDNEGNRTDYYLIFP